MWPNLVIDGKGRFFQERILDKDTIDDDEIMTSKRRLLSSNKSVLKVMTPPGASTKTMKYCMICFNDYNEDLTVNFKVSKILPTGVTAKIYDGVTEITTATFSKTISARDNYQLQLQLIMDTTAEYDRISEMIIECWDENNEDNSDVVAACLGAPIMSYATFQSYYEQLTTDLSVFPTAGVTYNAQAVVTGYLEMASEEFYSLLGPLWKKCVPVPGIARQYVTLRTVVLILLRTCAFAATGANIWGTTINLMKNEIDDLATKITGT